MAGAVGLIAVSSARRRSWWKGKQRRRRVAGSVSGSDYLMDGVAAVGEIGPLRSLMGGQEVDNDPHGKKA